MVHINDDDGRISKVAAWVKKKLGMRQTEGNNEETATRQMSKYLNRAIEVHASKPIPSKYENEIKSEGSEAFISHLIPGMIDKVTFKRDSSRGKSKDKSKETDKDKKQK